MRSAEGWGADACASWGGASWVSGSRFGPGGFFRQGFLDVGSEDPASGTAALDFPDIKTGLLGDSTRERGGFGLFASGLGLPRRDFGRFGLRRAQAAACSGSAALEASVSSTPTSSAASMRANKAPRPPRRPVRRGLGFP